MVLTITYQASPDFKLSEHASDAGRAGISLDGVGNRAVAGQMGRAMAFIDVPPTNRVTSSYQGAGVTEVDLHFDNVSAATFVPSTAQQPQTFTAQIVAPPPTHDAHQIFGLVFPPGSGSITFTKISIAPGTGQPGMPFPMNRPPGGDPRSNPSNPNSNPQPNLTPAPNQ
jgi:hypothetical protein